MPREENGLSYLKNIISNRKLKADLLDQIQSYPKILSKIYWEKYVF